MSIPDDMSDMLLEDVFFFFTYHLETAVCRYLQGKERRIC